MRTRTLLILAVACGLAILVAGSIRLLSLPGDESSSSDDLRVGDGATAGDARVTVLAATETDGRMVVEVRLAGVDDPAGTSGFELLAGAELPVDTAASTCGGITVAPVECTLAFDTGDVVGDVRVLRFRRGEDEVRWSLTER